MKKNEFTTNFEIINKFRKFLDKAYKPMNPNDKVMVDESLQWLEIEKLGAYIRNENFFFITNVLDFSIVYAKNLEVIGMDSKLLNSPQYLNLTGSNGFLELSLLYNKILIELCLEHPNTLGFLKPQFISQLPITKANGEVILIKKTLSPFQYSASGKILSNLAEFTIIKENYNNEATEPRYFHFPKDLNLDFRKFFHQKFIEECSPFSPKEIIIMKAYNQNPDFTLNQLANSLEITIETLKSYNKSIISKAKDYMGPLITLKNAKDVSVFFERCGVI